MRAPFSSRTTLRAVLIRLLLTPDFLYHVALGDTATGKLTDHEMASRLSYLLWETMPDDALATAADRAELHTPEQVEAQLTRLAGDPRAQVTLTSCGRLALGPMTQAFSERSTVVSKCTTWPQACTPESVRPAHCNETGVAATLPRAFSRTSCTVIALLS